MLPETINECPQCGSKNYSLVGTFERPFEQWFENGQPKEPKESSISLSPQATQSIEGVVCKACNIHTIIEDEDTYERESIIFDLHTQVATLQGRVATPPGKEWKN
jgi:hypothetical protein